MRTLFQHKMEKNLKEAKVFSKSKTNKQKATVSPKISENSSRYQPQIVE